VKLPSRRSFLRAIRQLSILLGAMLIGVVWSAMHIDNARRRAAETQEALNDATSFVRLFAQNTNSLVKELDRVALFVRDHVEREDGLARFHELVAHARVLSDIAIQIAVAGADGIVVATSVQPAPSTPVDLSDREHFKVHAGGGADELFISKAVLGRVSGRWSIQLTRRLSKPDGSFRGVVVVSLSPEQLARFYSSLAVASAYTVSIVGSDGRVRASAGVAALPLDADINASGLMIRARMSPADVFFDTARGSERTSIVAYQMLADFPLLVSVTRPEEVRVGDGEATLGRVAPAVILTLVVLLAMFFSARRKLTLERARAALARSERRAQHRACLLDQKRSQLELTLEHMNHGILMVGSDKRLRVINRKAVSLLGLPSDEAGGDNRCNALLGAPDVPGAVEGTVLPPLLEWERQNGTVLELRTNALPDGGFVRTISDITERRRSEARILHLANHDPLTGLANRVLFHKSLSAALDGVQRGCSFALLLLDLDGFKGVNDTVGHPFGDKLLALVGDRLRSTVRADDVIARLGGDEFAILQSAAATAEDCRELAGRLVEVLGAPFLIEGQHVVIGASLGIARAPADGDNPDELMMAADMALYEAKAEGRGRYCFYRPELNHKVQARRQLEIELRAGVERCQFELHYQPLLDPGSGAITGFEALMRWPHPTRGTVPPASFIPVAEDIGLIVPLGEWALREACMHAAAWPHDVQIAINLSPLQFRSPTLRLAILKALEASGLPPRRLVLEITESTLLQQTEATLELLHDVRALGVTIAMDDFGTGYSSLSYLQRFPFDKVKIDRSFVASIGSATDSTPVLRAMIEVANALGMSTTAEGVETPAQLELLRALGCREVQGYLFSPARPVAEVPALLAQFSATKAQAA
jgi:diguanylate cyclase (GGDEF)-like protein